jgi:predicted ABC-type ATPase
VTVDVRGLLRNVLGTHTRSIVVLAGSNGAGKSTFYREFIQRTGISFVNADIIARSLNPTAPESVGYESARIAEAVRQDLVARGMTFCMETVLSDPAGDKVEFLRAAKAKGYAILLVYIVLENVDLSRARVQQRVDAGGHDVPDSKLASRFKRTRRNAANALRVADIGIVLDNSSVDAPFRHVETWSGGKRVEDLARR